MDVIVTFNSDLTNYYQRFKHKYDANQYVKLLKMSSKESTDEGFDGCHDIKVLVIPKGWKAPRNIKKSANYKEMMENLTEGFDQKEEKSFRKELEKM